MTDPQRTAQNLSKAFSELMADSQKVFEAGAEQTTVAVKEITETFEQVQKESGQVLESLSSYFNARYQASLDLGASLFGALSVENSKQPAKAKDALEKQLEMDKELYRRLTAHTTNLQACQTALVKELVSPRAAVLEASQKQIDGVVKFGTAMLEAYEQMVEGFYTWPAQPPAKAAAQAK